MTHPTDEQLDALVKRMENVSLQVGVPSRTILDSDVIRRAADAITALRAQLAEARADLTFMTENRNKWQDSATQRWFRIEKANSRAIAASQPADPITNAGCRQPVRIKPSPDEHYDDYCIRQFAKLMSEKMAASRAKGRSGWNDPERCSIEYLRSLLYEHLDKGDPVDVANFCMMLRHYEASTYREFCNCTPQPSPDVAAKVQALVDAGERITGPLWRLILADENCIENPCDLPTCECRQKFNRIAGPLFAALAALKEVHK